MKKRPPLSLDEHRQLGLELSEMRNRMVTLAVDLSGRYRQTRSPRRALRAQAALDDLRSELDNQLLRDHPDDFEPRVYYRPHSRSSNRD